MPNIMIVEDDPSQLSLFKAILQKTNYNIYTYLTVSDALKYIANPIDLILVDLALPIINGFQFLTYIRTLEKFDQLPIIAITANANFNTEKMAHKSGFTGLIKKPITNHELRKEVAKYLSV